ncbi:secreted RxLR effector protein 161-like [Coffea arabica]|uniref:Secreted RxLR effector protein 161-like n=1 Tax=Coffea arabica TaxID=13443 RepID=A0ABM4VMJ8_COFAR
MENEKLSKDDGAAKFDKGLYRSLVGCLMYLTATRPDIMYAVSLLSRFMHCASELHFKAAKKVLRSTSGYLFNLGSGCFSWNSKEQDVVIQSTAEAEYVAATAAVNQALWLRKLLADLNQVQQEATQISVDNEAAIAISNNPIVDIFTKALSKTRFECLRRQLGICSKSAKEEC